MSTFYCSGICSCRIWTNGHLHVRLLRRNASPSPKFVLIFCFYSGPVNFGWVAEIIFRRSVLVPKKFSANTSIWYKNSKCYEFGIVAVPRIHFANIAPKGNEVPKQAKIIKFYYKRIRAPHFFFNNNSFIIRRWTEDWKRSHFTIGIVVFVQYIHQELRLRHKSRWG